MGKLVCYADEIYESKRILLRQVPRRIALAETGHRPQFWLGVLAGAVSVGVLRIVWALVL